ncbi:MAG: hypothetical protein WD079_02640, partial [Phycisphaeraceae bacterium]
FISSHLVHELERICDWVGVMDRGRLVAELPMQSFKNGIKRLRIANAPALPDDDEDDEREPARINTQSSEKLAQLADGRAPVQVRPS